MKIMIWIFAVLIVVLSILCVAQIQEIRHLDNEVISLHLSVDTCKRRIKNVGRYASAVASEVEDLKTANQDLQDANEDLQNANDDLNSDNDDLNRKNSDLDDRVGSLEDKEDTK